MTIKQIIYLLLAVMLVAVFAATGVFADSGSTMSFVVGDNPQFTEAYQRARASFTFPSDLTAGTYHLFNNVDLLVSVSDPNNPGILTCSLICGNFTSPSSATLYRGSTYNLLFLMNTNYVYLTGENESTAKLYVENSLLDPSLSLNTNNTLVWSYIPSVVGERFNFTIPVGYALLIQGDCDIIERDYRITNSWNFYQYESRRVNGSRERIVSTGNIVDGFSFDHNLTYAQAIQWIPRNANLFGSSTDYEYTDHTLLSVSSGSTFLISNPQYIGIMENVGNVQTKENSVPLTGTIYIEYTSRPSIKYIALESQIDFNQVGVYYNVFRPDVYEEEGSVTTNGNDVIVTPDYTGTTVPPDGGNNGQAPYNPDETVEGLLSQLVSNIQSLFSRAAEAMRSISQSCNSFFNAVLSFFGWLPPEWSSVLWSFFLILTVLGVVKAFL